MRRATLVVLTSAALTGLSGLVLPAYGQTAGVSNTGEASASTGGNSSVGNASGNTVASESGQTTGGGLLGLNLINIGVGLGSQGTNTSNGTSAVNTGPATATGNSATNGVTQSNSGGGGAVLPFVGPIVPAQSAGVSNSGTAAADTGGNTSVGNDSDNSVTANQTQNAGLINIGVNIASVANASNGTSTIDTGAATATGNEAVNDVSQTRSGSGFGRLHGPGVCEGFRNLQAAEVDNAGSAQADTGGNTSVGNQSTNTVTSTQNTSGGLINLPINLSLGANLANASDGQSAINTGPATASGNRATTGVVQECLRPATHGSGGGHVFGPHHPHKVFDGHKIAHKDAPKFQLARTGVDPFVMGLVAFALLFGGFLFLVWERVESLPTGRPPAA